MRRTQCTFAVVLALLGLASVTLVATSCVGDDPQNPIVIVADGGDGAPTGCSPSERSCSGAEMRGCKLDGTGFEVLGACATDALCLAGLASGKCVEPACAAAEVKCLGNDRVRCRADRSGTELVETCPSVCVAGECKDCIDGTGDCVGVTPRKCVANVWANQTPCAGGVTNACYAGTCTDTRIARWPMPNEATAVVRPAKYTVVSTNVVRDEVTKLEWQRDVSGPVATAGGARAKYCETLVLDGKQGWHLASMIELVTLLDHGKTGQKIDTTMFFNTPTSPATPIGLVGGENTSTSPRVNYDDGTIESASVLGASFPVRCVRATEPPPSVARFTVSTNEILDNWTMLVWQKTDSAYTTQNGAISYCVLPWRLPTLKEILTIFDPSQPAPYYDKTVFTRPDGDIYWSSSNKAGTGNKLAIDFSSTFAASGTPFDGRVRCVK